MIFLIYHKFLSNIKIVFPYRYTIDIIKLLTLLPCADKVLLLGYIGYIKNTDSKLQGVVSETVSSKQGRFIYLSYVIYLNLYSESLLTDIRYFIGINY